MPINSIGAVDSQIQASQQVEPAQPAVKEINFEPMQKKSYEPVETARGTKSISEEAVQKNIDNLNELLKAKQTNVTMEYDKLSSPKIVNIIDASSGNVIRQMPPESVVEIALKARDYVIGLMIDKTV
jgi:flagellar protein FlaG